MNRVFSPNMIKTFDLCPKKYIFKYEKFINMPVNDEIFEFGKNIHALASYYLKGENVEKFEKSLTIVEKNVWEYLKSTKYFGYKVINTEYNLTVKVAEAYFGGRLDALLKSDETYYILDYKTGAIPKKPIYDYQTMIYSLCVNEYFKTDYIKFVYIDLKNKTDIVIDFTPELKEQYKKRLGDIINRMNSLDETSHKTNCKCEYSLVCY